MTNEQKTLLGDDYGFALLPYPWQEAITKHNKVNYKDENIDDVLNVNLGALGKFWKFIDGTIYLKLDANDNLTITKTPNQNTICLVAMLNGVDKIIAHYQNGTKEYPTDISVFKQMSVCVIDFDFNNPIQELELVFNYDLTAPLKIKVNI